jgi:hypothetical protein
MASAIPKLTEVLATVHRSGRVLELRMNTPQNLNCFTPTKCESATNANATCPADVQTGYVGRRRVSLTARKLSRACGMRGTRRISTLLFCEKRNELMGRTLIAAPARDASSPLAPRSTASTG